MKGRSMQMIVSPSGTITCVYGELLDLAELGLKNVLDGLCLDSVPSHFQLCVDTAKKMHALRLNIDFAFVPRAVEAAELRMCNEFLSGLFREVAVASRDVHPANAKLALLAMGQWTRLAES